MARVLVVGAGLTGAAGAALLRGAPRGQVAVWDKARGAGGRMSTTRTDRGSADLGAQFVTCEPELAGPRLSGCGGRAAVQSFGEMLCIPLPPGQAADSSIAGSLALSFYEELVTHGILQPLTAPVEGMVVREGSRNYVAPQGISSVVKYYLEQSGAEVSYEQHVTHISLRDGRWEVSRKAGPPEHFDVVILTMPVPQILQLQGDIVNKSPDIGPSVVVHTTVTFGSQHLDSDPAEVQQIILSHLQKIVPSLPKPSSIKCHRWRYSQVAPPGSAPRGMEQPLFQEGGGRVTGFIFKKIQAKISPLEEPTWEEVGIQQLEIEIPAPFPVLATALCSRRGVFAVTLWKTPEKADSFLTHSYTGYFLT
ncbi:renalase isoform X6 [Passer domesticus]|uniref:renalase isoform X6 n=1 Tax=Passer domesticus TaxID=48849 RepID=UPI0030FF34D8